MSRSSENKKPQWGELFLSLLTEPGKISEAYSLFHRFSIGNMAIAMMEMQERGIPLGPISSFNGWKKVGRQVKRGEKAISLWMPVVKTEKGEDGEEVVKRFFLFRPRWFALAQTEPIPGAALPVQPAEPPGWRKNKALKALSLAETEFSELDGNVQGYAIPHMGLVSVNPLAKFPIKTLFHEMAHCLLHKEAGILADGERIGEEIREAEAEATAFLCCAALGLGGLDECRGYVQAWLSGSNEKIRFLRESAARVFSAANTILSAGREQEADGKEGGDHADVYR